MFTRKVQGVLCAPDMCYFISPCPHPCQRESCSSSSSTPQGTTIHHRSQVWMEASGHLTRDKLINLDLQQKKAMKKMEDKFFMTYICWYLHISEIEACEDPPVLSLRAECNETQLNYQAIPAVFPASVPIASNRALSI